MIINDVSIIIVNYNTKQMTNECIESIIAYTNGLNYEIILVDNGSSDGSKEFFEKKEGIVYIYSNENLGFGRANNLGAEKATGEYLFLLNSDTLLFENSLKYFLDFYNKFNEKLSIGVLGCLLRDSEGMYNSYGGDFPTLKIESYELFNFILKYFRKKNNRNSNDVHLSIKNEEIIKVDYVIGADMFIKTELFHRNFGFDPFFFMYYEESDFQLNLRNKFSLNNYILKGTQIFHFEGSSIKYTTKVPLFKKKIMLDSKYYYFKKNFKKQFLVFYFFQIVYATISLCNRKYTLKERLAYIKYCINKI